ncbi:MAG: hypothetical protein EX267_04880 [Acidimicrobiia bacterium]|nr:MAG: hypothetical protein EX267_04880 [Acidimicrobiia bacterium]
MKSRSPPGEPAVQVLDVTQDGETSATGSEPRASPRWLVVAVVVALATGLGYGFVLGRGDRSADGVDRPASTTNTTALEMTSVNVGTLETYPVAFHQSEPGHDLGRRVTEYLNPNVFRTIAFDEDGLIWAGGPAGVVRLNPATGEFDRLTDSDGTGPLGVHELAAGPDGSMFAATARGISRWNGFEWIQGSVVNQEMSENGRLTPEVGPLAVASDGTVWLVTRERSAWTTQSHIHHGPPPFHDEVPTTKVDGYIEDLAIGPEGVIWALADDSLWRYDGAWSRTSLDGWPSAISVDTEGGVWLARDTHIVHIMAEDGAPTTIASWVGSVGLDETAGPLEGFIQSMAAGPDGSVWALAEVFEPGNDWAGDNWREVLIRIADGAISTVALSDDRLHTWITDMAVAPNGDLWLATKGRLMQFDGTEWSEFFIEDQPPIIDVGTMTVGPSGDLWLAGNAGVARFTSDGWLTYARAEFSVAGVGDLNGDMWVDSAGERVWAGIGCRAFEYRAARWDPLPPVPDDPVACWVAATATRSEGSLWLAVTSAYEGTYIYRWAEDEWSLIGQAPFEPLALDVGPDGAVWLAGWDGLGRIEGDQWRPLVTGQWFEQVVVGGNGTVWASAQDWRTSPELWRLADGVWDLEPWDADDSTTVTLTRDPDGSMWALEQSAYGRFVARGWHGGHHFIVEAGELRTIAIGPDGTIWVGGDGQLYRKAPPGEVTASSLEVLTFNAVDWRIDLDDWGRGIHTVHMNVVAQPLAAVQVVDTSGRLVWDETTVELCAIGTDNELGSVRVGDTFQTTEGCGSNPTAMQDAFDEFGLPDEACVFIEVNGHDQPISYCAPLATDESGQP